LPAAKGFVGAGVLVDRDPHVDVLGVLFLGGRGERHLERPENDIARDVLLARENVHQHHQLTVSCRYRVDRYFRVDRHLILSVTHSSGTSFARSTSSSARATTLPSSSRLSCPCAAPRNTPTNLRRPPASAVRMRISALCPVKRAKSASLRNGRSSPGEDTSSRS